MSDDRKRLDWDQYGDVGTGTDAPHQLLQDRFERVLSRESHRIEVDRYHYALYSDEAYQGLGSVSPIADASLTRYVSRLREPVMQRVIRTQLAKLSRQKPKPTVLTDGADWDLQREGEATDRYLWARIHDGRLYSQMQLSDLHAMVIGTGVLYVTDSCGIEVCPPDELHIDPVDAKHGKPRTIYRRYTLARDVLLAKFPKYEEEIVALPPAQYEDVSNSGASDDADMVTVIGMWMLPSMEDADDGRYVLFADGVTLENVCYESMRHRFAIFRYHLAPKGFWGIGLLQGLVALQAELNVSWASRQEAMRTLSAPFVVMERGSQIVKTHMSDGIGRIVEHNGPPPQIVVPGPISPVMFEHSDRVRAAMFTSTGVSELAASAQTPAGLESGKALRTYADIVDQGIADVIARREEQVLQLAEIILDVAETLGPSHVARAVEAGKLFSVRWSETVSDRDAVRLRIQPASSLSQDLAGKLQDVGDMRDLGIVTDPASMAELLGNPDLRAASSRSLPERMRAAIEFVLEHRILRRGEPVMPDPQWDLLLCARMGQATLLDATNRGAPEDRLDLLRGWTKECAAMLAETQVAAQPPTAEGPPVAPMTPEGMVPPTPAVAPDGAGDMAPAPVMQ